MSKTKRTSLYLAILLTLAICSATVSCTTTSVVGHCPRFGDIASDEFEAYMRKNGQTHMVQAMLRRAQWCKGLRENS